MSNPSFPKVGVEFVAQNVANYARDLQNSIKAESDLAKEITNLSTALKGSEVALSRQKKFLDDLAKGQRDVVVATTIFKQIASTGGGAGELASSSEAVADAQDKLQKSINRVNDALEQQRQKSETTGASNAKLGDHFTSLSSNIGASRVGVGLFTRELVQLAGGGTVATQALDSFVYSTGTLGIALGVVTAGLVLIRSANESLTESFKKQQTEIANTSRDYATLYNRLQEAQRIGSSTSSLGGIQSGISSFKDAIVGGALDAVGQQLGNAYGKPFTEALKGNIVGMFADIIGDANIITAWEHIGTNAAIAFAKGFKQKQEESATQLFVQGAQTRANASALGAEIGNLELEGKTYDELIPKVYEYLQAKKAIGEAEGSGVGGAITGTDIEGFLQSNFPSQALSQRATALAKSLRDIQSQYNDDSAQLAADHGSRILEIESSGWEQQVRLARDYSQRKKDIQDQYNQDTADAYTDYRQRVTDAETNAQESRTKIAADYADKREKIEQDYQDKIQQIQSEYTLSLIDIDARRDGLALLRARASRDKQLADAAKTRDRENADNEKQKAKQEKDLADALEKQKKQLDEDYARRVRDLKQAYDKQNATADQNYRDSLTDLAANIAAQYAAENDGYKKRQTALDDAKQKRINALTDELFTTKELYTKYGQAIIDSLAKVLDPATIVNLVNGLQKALDTQIEIKITPNIGAGGVSAGKTEKTYAEGGYIDYTQRALIHAGETVLPATNAQRAYDLASQHLSRVSMPLSGRYMSSGSGNGGGGSIKLYIDNSINSALLSSQIRAESIGIAVDIVKRARS